MKQKQPEKKRQINLHVEPELYKQLTIRAIQESAKTGEIIGISDLMRLALCQYLNGGK